MTSKIIRNLKLVAHSSVAAFLVLVVSTFNTSPANAFAGTLENGNLAYAQGSGFDKGEACIYLPGFETGYDAWHFVLTSRGATFQQSPTNPAVSINLNFIFMRQDGSLFVIKSGAWVQTGKGAYTYTRVEDKIRMVQAGTVAQINGLDSGMRLSHTCPGSGSAPVATTSPTPTPTASTTTTSPSPTPTATTSSPSPTATRSSSPTPTASRSASPSPTPITSSSPTPTRSTSASPTPTNSSTSIPTLRPQASPTASARQTHPVGPRNPLPTPTPTQQYLTTPSPTPSPSSSRTPSPSPSSSPTTSSSPSPSTEPSSSPSYEPPVVPTPPPVEDPKEVIYVDPITPTVIPPKDLPSTPNTPIEIVIPPKYGEVKITPTGQIEYKSNLTDPTSTVVDTIEFKYTNLSGQTVVVRKQFILAQKGDVPKIIQTGVSFKQAAPVCKPVKPTGKTVGQITAGSASLPIKSFNYPAGGIMEPQKSTFMAAVSQRHQPLSATMGTSVIVWHVDYSGCGNELNVITKQSVGYKFKIKDENGDTKTYKISKKYVVKKGKYQASWFNLIGPRQLLLVTCTGAFQNGHYQDNAVLIAVPV